MQSKRDEVLTELQTKLRTRVAEFPKRDAYYVSEEEYRVGCNLGIYHEVSRKPQGSGVISVTVSFEGNLFTCSLPHEED